MKIYYQEDVVSRILRQTGRKTRSQRKNTPYRKLRKPVMPKRNKNYHRPKECLPFEKTPIVVVVEGGWEVPVAKVMILVIVRLPKLLHGAHKAFSNDETVIARLEEEEFLGRLGLID
jgi:hypothetical protein